MAIITMSREFGSNGGALGQMILNTLHYQLVNKALIEKVLSQYELGSFQKIYEQPPKLLSRFDNEYKQFVSLLNQTILAFARFDHSLIVGRGGFAVLRDYHNVLNVFITAPFEDRVRNALYSEQLVDLVSAEYAVRQNDRLRDGFLQTFYNVAPDSSHGFNLCIDTSRIPLDMAARWIMEAAKAIDEQQIRPENNSLHTEVDPVLAGIVASVLKESKPSPA